MQSGLKDAAVFVLTMFFTSCFGVVSAMALDLPAGPLLRLEAEEFGDREAAQVELLAWAREKSEPAVDELIRQSRVAENPETRERCLSILRELANDEYLTEGEGYMGIRMLDEIANVPGDQKPRAVIRVIGVVQDSAAHQAGLKIDDLIAGLNEEVWTERAASLPFSERIRQFKPNTSITLKVLRDNNLVTVKVKLGRRPPSADILLMNSRDVDLGAADRAAKDAFFRSWLSRKRSGN